jgi:hypothetical protein
MAPDAGPLAVPGCAGRRRALAAGQAAGRHRVPPRGSPRRPPSLLFVDYPAGDGPVAGHPVRTFAPVTGRPAGTFAPGVGRRRGVRVTSRRGVRVTSRRGVRVTSRRGVPAAGPRAGLRSVGYDVALAVALACLAAAVLVGIALAHARVAAAGGGAAPGARAAPGLPQPGALLPSPGATSPSPVASPDRAHRTARPGRRRATTMRARPKPATNTPTQTPTPTPVEPAAQEPAVQKPAVVVRYLVTSRGPAGFQAEIQVINNTAQPIGSWQIVVTLYDDAVVSVTNADGDFSNGILLLSPASPAQVAPPDGGVLDVFFTADGFQTVPAACAFDGIYCGP